MERIMFLTELAGRKWVVAGVAAKEAVAGWQWQAGSGGISGSGGKLCGGSGDMRNLRQNWR